MVTALGASGGSDEGNGGDAESGIPEPKPQWIADFQQDYYIDLSGDPVLDTSGRYTPALVETLDECGAGRKELE